MTSSSAGNSAWSSWSNLWQVPTIVISVTLIAIGLYASIKPPSHNDFDGAMNQVDQFITAGQFEDADKQLHETIEPHIGQASLIQQARFQATLADLTSAIQSTTGSRDDAALRRVIDGYAEAGKLGLTLSVARLERWSRSCIALGEFADAQQKLSQLEELEKALTRSEPEAAQDAHTVRNRMFRLLVESSLRRPETSDDQLLQMLTDYRADQRLGPDDEIWAIARQAEIRLQAGQSRKAVESLLVDMRRVETRGIEIAKPQVGELYTLLGRGYFDLGDFSRATNHLQHALEQFAGPEPARGDALVVLGRIALAGGDPDSALEKFQLVVRDSIGTPAYLAGVLGRAETQGILGDHQQSLNDYQMLRDDLVAAAPRRDITPAIAAQSLCNRHDAALALGNLDGALSYESMAESFFKPDLVPDDVLVRLASTHRQIADNLLAKASETPTDDATSHSDEVNPDTRNQANVHYEKAGDYYLRHTTSQASDSINENDWLGALWLAADSYDRGGRQDLAIRNFNKYLDVSPIDDQRRAETLFRMGRAQQAELNFDQAIKAFEQVLSENSRSTFAARVHVPLARCYLSMNRRPEAEQQLRQVLDGARLLTPEAEDYGDALVELGIMSYENNEFIAAIEQFTEAMERYPNDRRRLEIEFRLADSYRSSAADLDRRLTQPPPLPPAEQNRLTALRSEQLQKSLELFGQVCEVFGPDSKSRLNPLQQDMIRRAHLYQADGAFQLNQFETAIGLYDRAARLYSGHSSSMYALVQIVNCYTALGDADRAGAAHHRALVRLKQLPDAAFNAPESLMDRAAWEKWLDNDPVGPVKTAAANPNTG